MSNNKYKTSHIVYRLKAYRLSQVYQYDTQIDASDLLVTNSEKAADLYMDYAL